MQALNKLYIDNSNTTTFDYLGLNVPMGKFGMGFGVIPHSSVGYNLESRNNIDSLEYKYSGNGGVNKVFLGFGYLISENLSIGIMPIIISEIFRIMQ